MHGSRDFVCHVASAWGVRPHVRQANVHVARTSALTYTVSNMPIRSEDSTVAQEV